MRVGRGRRTFHVLVRESASLRLLKGTKAIESDGTILYSQPSNAWQEGIKILQEPEASRVAAQTVFGLDWGVIISDEVQGVRTLNRFYTACRMLRPKSEMVIGMSATPGITSPMVRDMTRLRPWHLPW